MKVIESENAKRIIEILVPRGILELKPVIAGGFIVNLYYSIMRHSNEKFDMDISRKIDTSDDLVSSFNFRKNFNDIDIWFLKDNDIWLDDNEGNKLIMDFKRDVLMDSPSDPLGIDSRTNAQYHHSSKENFKFLDKMGLSVPVTRSSYWANSFRTNKGPNSYRVQCIKKPYESIEDLFSMFDLINCCAAYHDGKFYLHDDFEYCADNYTLEAGPTFFRSTAISRIWGASRAFKYASRYNLEFSEEICDKLTSVFVDAEFIITEIAKGKYDTAKQEIDLATLDEISDAYGRRGIVDVSKVSGMINGLLRNFKELIKMKKFDTSNVFLFVNAKNTAISNAVCEYIENESSKNNLNDGSNKLERIIDDELFEF